MQFPVWMFLLKLVMNCSAIHIFHRNKYQVQLLGKIPVNIFRQQFLQKNQGSIRTGHLVCMMAGIDNLTRASGQPLRHRQISLVLWFKPDRIYFSSGIRYRCTEHIDSFYLL